MNTDAIPVFDELRHCGEELRQAFADERDAIAALDHAKLEMLATHKRDLANQLGEITARLPDAHDPLVRDLFAAIRVEAHATSMLAATATAAVRGLLGYETNAGYDRRANHLTRGPSRYLATY